MSPQSSSSAPDADLQLAEQDSAGRHPNAFTTRVEEADTSISYGRGGAGNLRKPTETASGREELSESRSHDQEEEDKGKGKGMGTLFKSTTGEDATGVKSADEMEGSNLLSKAKGLLT